MERHGVDFRTLSKEWERSGEKTRLFSKPPEEIGTRAKTVDEADATIRNNNGRHTDYDPDANDLSLAEIAAIKRDSKRWLSLPDSERVGHRRVQTRIEGERLAASAGAGGGPPTLPPTSYKELQGRSFSGLTSETIDEMAHNAATKAVGTLLYDFSQRSVISSQLRLMLPFAEAYREVLSVWAKVIKENPAILRRSQQVWNAGTQPSYFGELNGSPEGEGFIRDDPNTGQKVFNVPLLSNAFEAIQEKLAPGLPVQPLTMGAAGLNIVSTTIAPSGGPIPQAAVAITQLPGIGKTLQFKADRLFGPMNPRPLINEWLFPFGQPSDLKGIMWNSLPMPQWAKSTLSVLFTGSAARDRREAHVARVLMSTGDYNDKNGSVSQEQLDVFMGDVRKQTRFIGILETASKFVTPSSSSFQWTIEDKNGNKVLLALMAQDWRKIQKANPEVGAALKVFTKKWGAKNILGIGPRSIPIEGYLQSTEEAIAWRDENAIFAEANPEIFGLFGPSKGKFSYQAWSKSVSEGRRRVLTLDEQLDMAQSRAAAHQLDVWAKNESIDLKSTNKQIRKEISDKKEQLDDEFHKRRRRQSDFDRWPDQIKMVLDLANSKTTAKFGVTAVLKRYKGMRERVLGTQEGTYGLSEKVLSESKKVQDEVAWLWDQGQALAQQNPEFRVMWDDLLSRERGFQ